MLTFERNLVIENNAVAQNDFDLEIMETFESCVVDLLLKDGKQTLTRVNKRDLLARMQLLDVGRELHAKSAATYDQDRAASSDFASGVLRFLSASDDDNTPSRPTLRNSTFPFFVVHVATSGVGRCEPSAFHFRG